MKLGIALTLVGGVLAAGCPRKARTEAPAGAMAALSPEEVALLDERRAVIQDEATQRYHAEPLTRTKADLPILQRLLDDHVFAKNQTYQLQCLGVVFGDVLATELPLWWVRASDHGKSWPTLRYKETTAQVDALNIISSRIEHDEKVILKDLLRSTGEALAKGAPEGHP